MFNGRLDNCTRKVAVFLFNRILDMLMKLLAPGREGRPEKLNDHVADVLVEYISNGNYISTSCQAAGIDQRTFCYWREKADAYAQYLEDNNIYIDDNNNIDDLPDYNKTKIYFQLFQRLKTAEAKAEMFHVSKIKEAANSGPQYWTASATFLSRRWRDKYAESRDNIEANKETQALLIQLTKALKEAD